MKKHGIFLIQKFAVYHSKTSQFAVTLIVSKSCALKAYLAVSPTCMGAVLGSSWCDELSLGWHPRQTIELLFGQHMVLTGR